MAPPSAPRASLGLAAAIREMPALAVPVFTALALLDLLITQLLPQAGALPGLLHALLYAPAVLLGLVLYALGGVWDEFLFDRWYGPAPAPDAERAEPSKRAIGLWSDRGRRSFGLFPAGRPLDAERATWNALAPAHRRGYRGAATAVREAGRWAEVEAPLVLSKFARSFIAPALLVALVFVLLAVLPRDARVPTVRPDALACVLTAEAALLVAAGALLPYVEFRVEHMRRLYRLAADLLGSSPHAAPGSVDADRGETLPPRVPVAAAPARDAASALVAIVAIVAAVAVVALLVAYGLGSGRNPPPAPGPTPAPPLPGACCGCAGAGDSAAVLRELAALRALIEKRAGPGTPACPAAPDAAGKAGDGGGRPWAWVLGAVSVLVALGGLAIALRRRNGTGLRLAGLATATLGPLLSFGGFTLIKDPKLDINIDEISFKILRELRTEVGSSGPQNIGSVAPFVVGERDQVEGGTLQSTVDAMARLWVDQRRAGKDGVLLIVGATDRLPLRGAKQGRYEANVGLARARAEFVKDRLAARVQELLREAKLPADLGLQPGQVLLLVSGPASTPAVAAALGASAAPAQPGHPGDRRVDVWAFWSTRADQARR